MTRGDSRTEKQELWMKRGLVCLLLLTALAAVKNILSGLDIDESYAVTAAVRLTKGDRFFREMWEPHQTSAILTALLIKVYTAVLHTSTGILLYLKAASLLIHGLVSYCVYRVMKRFADRTLCVLGMLLYFNLSPKEVMVPEFSLMQVWSVTLLILCLIQYTRERKPGWMAGAGVCMCSAVLAYPSCALLFPIAAAWLVWQGRDWKGVCLFTGVCLAGAALFLGYIFSYMNMEELLFAVREIIASDGFHDSGSNGLWFYLSKDMGATVIFLALYAIAVFMYLFYVRRRKGTSGSLFWEGCFAFLPAAAVIQLTALLLPTEMFLLSSFVYYFLILGLLGAICHREKEMRRFLPVLLCGAGAFAATVLLSNLTIYDSSKYMMSSAAVAAVLLADRTARRCGSRVKGYVMLFCLCMTAVIYRGYALNSPLIEKTTVFDIRGVVKEGPAAGTLTDYMSAYIRNSAYQEFRMYVRPGDKLFIASEGTLDYLDVENVDICASSTISTPTYDEHLLNYWESNPEKYPTVVAVDCWYGDTRYPEDTWLGNWLENEFCADEVADGQYYRFYIKR